MNHNKFYFIEDIIKLIPNTISSQLLIKYEYMIISFIKLMLHDISSINMEKMMDICVYLNWVYLTSQTLSERIGQKIKKNNINKKIIRSSYNFCPDNCNCSLFYTNDSPKCKKHHYVHSIICHDVQSIINFIKYSNDNSLQISTNDINNLRLSIKTMCFVTTHMMKEIDYIHIITNNESEKYHRNNFTKSDKIKNVCKKKNVCNKTNKINKTITTSTNRYMLLQEVHCS